MNAWSPSPLPDPEAFIAALHQAGYRQRAILDLIKPEGHTLTTDPIGIRRRLADSGPLACLVRLFILGEPLAIGQVRNALSAAVADRLVGPLLVSDGRERVRSPLKLMPFQDWYLAADFMPDVTGQPLSADCVMGVGTASMTLADLTVRQPVRTALDLGTGGGIQALLAARHAGRVVATDLNPRALAIARFNAALNGLGNIDFRQGSFDDPVAGETFDVVVTNPPFVISPGNAYTFRDGGLQGDGVSEHVVRLTGRHLTPGGFATILLNWHHADNDDWATRPLAWLADGDCEAWLLCFETGQPLDYALRWLRDSEGNNASALDRNLDAWLHYYDTLGARRISAGALILRKVAGRPRWTRADHIAGVVRRGACGAQIVRVFEAETFLRTLPNATALADECLRFCPEHEVHQVRRVADDGRWTVREQTLRPLQGINLSGRVDDTILAILERCDGTRPFRRIVHEVTSDDSHDAEETFANLAARMLRAGILMPPAGAR